MPDTCLLYTSDYKEINHGKLITLADFYGVSVDYLLCRTENREQINTPLTELHLNDEMVALLKSGRINNLSLIHIYRSGSDLFHLRDGFEIKMNFDRNVSCFIFVNALKHDDFFD